MDISIVIPVFGRSGSAMRLQVLTQRLMSVLDATGFSYEIVFIDDGSQDDSWQVLVDLQSKWRDRITAIQLMRNAGQHNALMCGFRRVHGQLVITMDDDLQNPPEEIPRLLDTILNSDFDLVYGASEFKDYSSVRKIGSRLVNRFYQQVFGQPVGVSSFRVIKRELIDAILTYELNYTFIDGLLAWNTQRIGHVPVDHHPRVEGKSGYTMSRLIVHALNVITNFSTLPLQIASAVGLLASISGLLVGGYYLTHALLSNIAVPGYASIIVAVMTLGGLQLLALGIIGEYIGRLHLNVNRKPQYTIRTVKRRQATQSPLDEKARMLER